MTLRKAFPRRISLRKGLANQLVANGDPDQAIKLFREVLQITPGDRKNREEFIALLERAERPALAAKEVRALLRERDEVDLWVRLVDLEDRQGNEEGVDEGLAKVLGHLENEAFGVIRAARLFTRYGRAHQGEEVLRKGREDFPEEGELIEALAALLAPDEERAEEAVALWRELGEGGKRDQLLSAARSLSAHGFVHEAFALLQERAGNFERDVLFLGTYCQFGVEVGESGTVWPSARRLARLADAPSSLENALQVALLVARDLDPEQLADEMAGSKSVGELCLLAELHSVMGLDDDALAILDRAGRGEHATMVAARRIRFLERRGDLDAAIAALRKMIAGPKGNRPIHVRRLVEMLVQAGRLEAALKEVDNWKRLAPGDRLAWKRRAELLRESGDADEALRELRRGGQQVRPGGDRAAQCLGGGPCQGRRTSGGRACIPAAL